MLSSIPSPSSEVLPVIGVKYYGLMIALGVLVAVTVARRRWQALGYDPDQVADIAVIAVPAGLIGSRVYHVVTDWNRLYSDGRWWPRAFEIWNGGLGIPGGIFFGVLAGYLAARRYKMNVPALIDAMVPAMPIAQAIGRYIGNWFNQELYGRPTDLPWGLEIAPEKRPSEFPAVETFHPTFLYEALWSLGAAGLLIWLDSRHILKRGRMLPGYLLLYFLGRLWVESIRIDTATQLWGLRVNTVLSLAMITIGAVWFLWGGPLRPAGERGVSDAVPAASDAGPDGPDGSDDASGDGAVLGEDAVADGRARGPAPSRRSRRRRARRPRGGRRGRSR